MTIKQQGGVFGRNPTFNDVTVDGDLGVTDGSVSGKLSFPDNAQARFGNSNDLLIYHNGANSLILDNGAGDLVLGCQNFRLMSNSLAKNMLKGFVDGSVEVYHNNVLAFSSGANGVVMPDGKGIDFSATSGTGTSELFDDYEEGTWTPTYLLTTTDFDSITYDAVRYGAYTKIGNKVFCTVSIRTDAITVGAGAGSLAIGGLPFTVLSGAANNASSGLPGHYASWASAPGGVYPTAGQTYATIGIPGTTSNATSAILNTGANSNFISLQFFYTAA